MINKVARDYLECVADAALFVAEWDRSVPKDPVTAFRRAQSHLAGDAQAALDLVKSLKQQRDFALTSLPFIRRARIFDLSVPVLSAALNRASDMVGVPDLNALPFDVCWFGMTDRVVLDLLGPISGDRSKWDFASPTAGGFVLSRCGLCFLAAKEAGGGWVVAPTEVLGATGWEPEAVEAAWACVLVADLAVQRGEKSNPGGLAVRRLMERAGRSRSVPPELYTVHLDARRASHAIGALVAPHAGPGYRFEVMGHPRMLVRRGRWPDEDRCKAWQRRDYEVYRGDRVPESWRIAMDLRGVTPPTDREWVALKIVQVRDHEKGPEGPVIPATRST